MDKQGADLLNSRGLTNAMRKRMMRAVERVVGRLSDPQLLKESNSSIMEAEISNMCCLLPETLLTEPPCVKIALDRPVYVVGDLRGQFVHLMHMLNAFGHPPHCRYVFLGNYADQSAKSLDTLGILFAYKLLYPNSIYLLRGKHESDLVGRSYGLYDYCLRRYSRRLWHDVTAIFTLLPAAVLLDEQILCVHGGLSPLIEFHNITSVAQLETRLNQTITRPALINRNSVLTHLIWSDPDENIGRWEQNPIGMGYLYGPKVVSEFCETTGIAQIIRSSEMVPNGYAFFTDPRLLTVFSAPDLASQYENYGAVMLIQRNEQGEIRCRAKIMKPISRLRCKLTTRVNVTFEEVNLELFRKAYVAC